jgi:putative hemolysin
LLGTSVESEEVATVGGLVYSELGRVPKPGEELHIDGFRVVVEQVVKRRIKRVYFERVASTVDQERTGEPAA